MTEPSPGLPLQSPSQAPQAWGQRKGPPQAVPPHKAIPHETKEPTPPSGQPAPRMKGPGDQPQHLVGPAGPAPGMGGPKGPRPSQELSSVASGGIGPRGEAPLPPSQAQRSSHAPAGKITRNEGKI